MRLSLFQIDAFTGRLFSGNPAAVCPLSAWLDAAVMQAIAAENNLSETAFIVPADGEYAIRWFTPTHEVDLCGHATLASAFVVFHELEPARHVVTFHSPSGPLPVTRDGERLCMDFPAREAAPCTTPDALVEALGRRPVAVLRADSYLAVYASEEEVRALQPHMERLQTLDTFGVIVTAASAHADFVSRFFAPARGVPEDPVTGSAHCTLIPYWAQRLQKTELHALQVSRRGGELFCAHRGERVMISGRAVKYLEGALFL